MSEKDCEKLIFIWANGYFRRRELLAPPTQNTTVFTEKDLYIIDFINGTNVVTFSYALLKPAIVSNARTGFLSKESSTAGLTAFGAALAQDHNLEFGKITTTAKTTTTTEKTTTAKNTNTTNNFNDNAASNKSKNTQSPAVYVVPILVIILLIVTIVLSVLFIR